MEDKNIQFLDKIDSLSEEARIYFYSQEIGQLMQEIGRDYNLDVDFLNDVLIDLFVSNFDFEKIIQDIPVNIRDNNRFICDFLGKLFLPVEPFIDFKPSNIILNYGKEIDDYKKYIENFNDIIEEKNLRNLDDVLEDLEKNFSFDEEENIILNILEKDLVEVLKDDDFSGRRQINGSTIYLLINKKDSLNKFIRALLINQEKLTPNPINLDGKKQEPTVANWIKHFIKENGSEMFSNITLVKYLTSSSDTASLNDNDKRVLKRMLKLYRNLIFFPDSMKDVPVINWEILPLESDISLANKDSENKLKKMRADNSKKSIKKDENLNEALNKTPNKITDKNSIKTLAETIPQLNLADQELEVLQKMLKKYPVRSLERKAVESEIKKRKK